MTTDTEPDLNNASWMTLRFEPTSQSSEELGKALSGEVFSSSQPVRRGRPPDREARQQALLAIVADILFSTQGDPERFVYRKYSRGSFTGQRVSYNHFRAAEEALVSGGFLNKFDARRNWRNSSFGQDGGYGRTTRWRATEKLFDFCRQFQITGSTFTENFRAPMPDDVVQARTRYIRNERGHRVGGDVVQYPETERTKAIASDVCEINEFLDKQDIKGTVFLGFQRKFNNVQDIASYRWNQGGRLYCVNYPDSYQCQPSEERGKITINGHSVVEIDIRASQLTVYHGVRGATFDPHSGDPYDLDGVPRDVAKRWFVITVGHGRFPLQWSPEASADYRQETGGRTLGTDYPVRVVQAAFIKKNPAVGKLPKSGLDSLDLAYVESEAVIAAMLELLRNHNVPSLPVHDSLIVPEQYEALVTNVLSDCYAKSVGIRPALEVKRVN